MDKILTFVNRNAFREWLSKYGSKSDGVWLLFRKKGGSATLTANDALEEALCYGWIDGQMQSIDENVYKKYFSRRRSTSNWSAKNKKLVQSLMEKGLVAPQGLEAVERARKKGLWDNPKRVIITDEQVEEFRKTIRPYELAYTNLLAMPQSVQRTYTGFYLDAKSDKTRLDRLGKIIDRLNKNLKPM